MLKCKECGSELQEQGKFFECVDDENCGYRISKVKLQKLNNIESDKYPNNLNPSTMVTYLAHPWDEYIKEEHPSVKLHWLVDTAEVVVRWVCALLLAEHRYANEGKLHKEIQQTFKENIARPTLGVWLNLVKALSKSPLKNPHLKNLNEFYSLSLNIQGLFPDDGDDKTSLLKLRNRIAHGGGTNLKQSQEYLDIYERHLFALLTSTTTLMGDAHLYGNYKDNCYLLQGLKHSKTECTNAYNGPYLKIDDIELPLWPLVEFDMVRQLDNNGIIKELSSITPQTYARTDKQGVQFIPMGTEESYSLTDRQVEFEEIFSLKEKSSDKSSKLQKYEYQHNDFLREARYLKEELIGRREEIAIIKNWFKTVDGFDDEEDCRYIHGGPGLGKSMIVASIVSDISNDKNHHTFYHRFRGGDARNSKYWFVKLLRDSLLSWTALNEITEEPEKLIDIDEIVKDIVLRIEKIKELKLFIKRTKDKETKEIREIEKQPTLRVFIDGLDEVLSKEPSIFMLIQALQVQGVVTLISTRLENSAQRLVKASWSKPIVFDESVAGLPEMSNDDIRAMLLEGISKAQRKELIKNDEEDNETITNNIVQSIAKKAEGLPLYIQLLLNDIQINKYSITDASKIPNGLKDYYVELVGRMGINDIDSYKAPVIALLSLVNEPMDVSAIALTLEDMEDAQESEELIRNVLLSVGTLLKQATTPEETIGYTLYHQSFKDFILQARDDSNHQLHRTLNKAQKQLNAKTALWQELPDSNLKNHLFRQGNSYTLEWQKDGVTVVKNRLTDLEYLLTRIKYLQSAGLKGLLEEYEVVQNILPSSEQDGFHIWSSFFREKLHLIARVDEEFWQAHQSLFQFTYEDGLNSPLTKEAELLLSNDKIKFSWLKRKNRRKEFTRSGLLRVMEGHSALITGVKILNDGRILSYSDDSTLILWRNNEEPKVLKGHNDKIKRVEILDDGKILSYSEDNVYILWNSNGDESRVVDETDDIISKLKLDIPDENQFFYSDEHNISFKSKEETLTLIGHKAKIKGVKVLSGGEILSFSEDKTLRLWNKQGKEEAVLEGHRDTIFGATIFNDGRILSYSGDRTIRLWNSDGKELSILKGHTSHIQGVKIVDDEHVISYSGDKTLRLWSLKDKNQDTQEEHLGYVKGIELLQDSKILSYATDNTLRLWSSNLEYIRKHALKISAIEILDDGRALTSSDDKIVRLWSKDWNESKKICEQDHKIDGMKVLENSKIVLYLGDKTLQLWNLNGEKLGVLGGIQSEVKHTGKIRGICALQTSKLVSYSNDKTLILWDTDTCEGKVLGKHAGIIIGVESLDNNAILSYSDDKTIRLWDVNGEKEILLGKHDGKIKGVKLVNNNQVISYSDDNTLRLWNINTKKYIEYKEGHTKTILGVETLKDGRILSYAHDNDLILWNHEGKIEKVLRGHTNYIMGVKLLDDGRILSYSKDATLRFWSNEGEALETFFLGLDPLEIFHINQDEIVGGNGNKIFRYKLNSAYSMKT